MSLDVASSCDISKTFALHDMESASIHHLRCGYAARNRMKTLWARSSSPDSRVIRRGASHDRVDGSVVQVVDNHAQEELKMLCLTRSQARAT
ncbi:hypothetical protein [Burkholderia ubonensis]|uniref:hypothetical protein n=1 Tax=Burkholderia ubonensis TaxID=101571 RepID=UPI000A6E3488|nr:hypothetical protein [Burkholderia ubonensis]